MSEEEYYKDIDVSSIYSLGRNFVEQMSNDKLKIDELFKRQRQDDSTLSPTLLSSSVSTSIANLLSDNSDNENVLDHNAKNNFGGILHLLETDAPLKASSLRPNALPPLPPPLLPHNITRNPSTFQSNKESKDDSLPIQINTVGVQRDAILAGKRNYYETDRNINGTNIRSNYSTRHSFINDYDDKNNSAYLYFGENVPHNDNTNYNVIVSNIDRIPLPPFGFLDSIAEVLVIIIKI